MRIRLRILGTTVLSLIFDSSPETVEEYEAPDDELIQNESLEIGGGSTHNFERHVEWYDPPAEDDRKFGFQ